MVATKRPPRPPKGCTYWFTLRTLWGPFRVYLVDTAIVPDMADKFALTLVDEGWIFLDERMPRSRLARALVHEAFHAVMSTPSEDRLLARILGCKLRRADKREEELVVHLSTKFADAFARSGLFKLPPLPKKRPA